ncbi:MAG: Hsp20/alpha crystallin family protein [Planctomycetaceae bacterium]
MTESTSPRSPRPESPKLSREPLQYLKRELDDVLSRFSSDWLGDWMSKEFTPAVDVSETDEAVNVAVDVPGVKGDEIQLEVAGTILRIRGERKEEKEEKNKSFHRVERRWGTFSRTVPLPCNVVEEKVTADYRDGVLHVHLPKTETAKAHKIKVKIHGREG